MKLYVLYVLMMMMMMMYSMKMDITFNTVIKIYKFSYNYLQDMMHYIAITSQTHLNQNDQQTLH